MENTFRNLEHAGEGNVEQRRLNGRSTILSRSYNLYSDIQEQMILLLFFHLKQAKSILKLKKE